MAIPKQQEARDCLEIAKKGFKPWSSVKGQKFTYLSGIDQMVEGRNGGVFVMSEQDI